MKVSNLNNTLSIITVNKNNYLGLINTLNSVRELKECEETQHIIIDGGSTDLVQSFNILQSRFIFNYVSEKDGGIYNAMNKGIKNSSNDYVLFLNSGDTFYNALSFSKLSNNIGNEDLIFGDIIDCGQTPSKVITYPELLSFEYMLCGGLPHQATAIRKLLFEKVGYYDEGYKIISDWVFFMEALFIHNVSYKHIPILISSFEGGGLSSISENTKMIVYEQLDYISKRFPNSIIYYFTNSPYVKKYLRQKSRLVRWFYKLMLIKFNKVL